jgi:hypothetical protein
MPSVVKVDISMSVPADCPPGDAQGVLWSPTGLPVGRNPEQDPPARVGDRLDGSITVGCDRSYSNINPFSSIKLLSTRQFRRLIFYLSAFLAISAVEARAEHLDHFLCYTVKASKGSPKFTPITGLSLDDQFEQGLFSVTAMSVLCVPAQKESEPLTNPEIHLMGYAIKGATVQATGVPRTNRTVVNQLGALTVNVGAAGRLLVPSLKSLDSDPGPPDPNSHDVDHFKCYAVTLSSGSAAFPKGIQKFVVDQFNQGKIYSVTGPVRICVPVDKAGEQIKRPQNELMCYAVAPVIRTAEAQKTHPPPCEQPVRS